MPKNRPKLCAYCGKLTTAWTKDHAVPDCMWHGPLPIHMVTVPLCRPCQQRWSADEGYFRTIVAAMAEEDQHPAVRPLINEKVASHIKKDRSVYRDLVGTLRILPRFDPRSNLFLGMAPTFKPDVTRFQRVGGKIVRGLYLKIRGVPLPDGYGVSVLPAPGISQELAAQKIINNMTEWKGMGDDTFMCRMTLAAEDPAYSAWLLVFYRSVGLFALTLPVAGLPGADPSAPV